MEWAELSSLEKYGLLASIIVLLYVCKVFLDLILTYVLYPAFNTPDFKSKGKWALVTGCTDGIGKEYAKQLASRGCDIVLVSRSIEKLTATANEIEKEYKVSTKIIQADFSEGDHIYENISKEIAGLEIGTLVNNVGVSYAYPEYFLDLPDWDNQINTMFRANIVSVTKMTGMVLPDMVKREKGYIINIGSASSMIPSPLLTVYAATKAYVDKFSEGLMMEYYKKGIFVQCVMPGFVCSNMSGIRRSTLFAPSAKAYVSSAIRFVGTSNSIRTTGYIPHALFVNIMEFFYNNLRQFSVWLVIRSMLNSRRKFLKKYKKQ